MKAFAVVISGLLLSAPVAAQNSDESLTNSGTQSPTQVRNESDNSNASQNEEDPNRRICRRVETNTGSRVPFRTLCLTERQWRTYRPN
jgi:hypothetical protein